MNERMHELARQSGLHDFVFEAMGIGEEFEKFAELIVRECSYLADQAHYKATGGKSAGGYIRQHFGVES